MFSIDQNTTTASSASYLKPNAIHDVKFKSVEATEVGGETKYPVLKFKFENAEGVFEDSIFPPKLPEGASRTTNQFGSESPSAVEELMAKLRHYISALNPELDKKIESGEKTLQAKDWNSLRTVVIKALEKSIDKEVQIKLLANGKNMAVVPGFILAISKNGNTYLRTKFIGQNLQFTSKELEKMTKINNPSPSNMDSIVKGNTSSNSDLDLDLDLEEV